MSARFRQSTSPAQSVEPYSSPIILDERCLGRETSRIRRYITLVYTPHPVHQHQSQLNALLSPLASPTSLILAAGALVDTYVLATYPAPLQLYLLDPSDTAHSESSRI